MGEDSPFHGEGLSVREAITIFATAFTTTTSTIVEDPVSTDIPPPPPTDAPTDAPQSSAIETVALSSTATLSAPRTRKTPAGSHRLDATRARSSSSARKTTRHAHRTSSSVQSTNPTSSSSPPSSTASSLPLLASSTPLSAASSHSLRLAAVLAGIFVPLLTLALLAVLCLRRRKRLQREWEATRAHPPEDGWAPSQTSSRTEADGRYIYDPMRDTPSPGWRGSVGSDVLLLGPAETRQAPPSPRAPQSHPTGPVRVPAATRSPSAVPSPVPEKPPLPPTPSETGYGSVSRAPSFRTVGTPPPIYTRSVPQTPVTVAH
ncbi:hypothetical protein B0H15DRAFT_166738 [Mycena belliarum]|uniref:Uncharacterized protein n=1 Tax=Mycena belliarum TaxID=1033014 RepID=A0AAD6U873_9AGAR|nr:hypothetical protein B0H15DRAFT_166738 [Mycena belliae]